MQGMNSSTSLPDAHSGRLVALFAGAKLLLHLATTSGYGYFRDELYYLACADHPAAGYVDHPPLSVLWLWLSRALLGDSRFALRLTPALLGAATVALVGLLARRMGGGRWAQALAMTGALVAPQYLAFGHFYSMNAFDVFFWALAAFLVLRVLEQPTTARWAVLGVALGLGLQNKIGVLWVGAGLLVGLLATRERRLLATPGPWIAGAIAAVVFAPHVAWQVANGWPTREFIHNAQTQKMEAVAPLQFLVGQVMMMSPFTLPLWLAGLGWLFRGEAGRPYRLLGWTYLTAFAILLASGASRSGYLSPAYTWLFAAGGVALERWLAGPRVAWVRPAFAALLLVTGVAIAPLALPTLPVDTYVRYARALRQSPETEEKKALGVLPQFYADMHGWDEIVDAVAVAHARLAPEERAGARVFAGDYGVAGAVDLLGRRRGLPLAISGHNNYWLWGPRGWDGAVVIVVGGREDQVRPLFETVEQAGVTDCGYCMPYENGLPVWIARGLRQPVAEAWPRLKHYE
jgi:4-amino-4-deoxy-L-arabinose transferase-like glycosyltransferase